MNLGNISNTLLPMMYQDAIRNNQSTETVDFSDTLGGAQTSGDPVENYTAHLKEKYGFNIRVESVGRDQKSLDKIGGTMRGNDLVIGPKILEKMANEPETAAKIEGYIDKNMSNIPKWTAEAAAKGLTFRVEGYVVHDDGTVTCICGGGDSPERVAEVNRINKEKREKEAAQQKQLYECSMEQAAARRTMTSSSGLTLRYRKDYVAEDGSTCVTSHVDARTGINTVIFKPADFDEENPVYRVETWDRDGNMTERMMDLTAINPQSATSSEMFAYSTYLAQSGKCKDALTTYIFASARTSDMGALYRNGDTYDWMSLLSDLMREQYTIGNRQGYLRYKAFYDAIEVL